MANIKSAKKRILVSRANAERNKAIKSGVKTSIKKVEAAVVAGDKEAAKAAAEAAAKEAESASKIKHFGTPATGTQTQAPAKKSEKTIIKHY